jgi:tetratricopeptide (TPR) repeat protein
MIAEFQIFRVGRWIRLTFLLMILFGVSAALAQKPPVAEVESTADEDDGQISILSLTGKVEIAKPDSVDWVVAKKEDLLEAGWRVRTGRRSKVTIRMSDLSILRVGQLSTLEIQPPKGDRRKRALDLKAGAAYFFNREGPSKVDFRTPIASGAIRGTEFMLEVDDQGRTVVTMFEGEVDLENELGSVSLGNGEQGTVEPGEAPMKTAVLDAVSVVQWMLYYPGIVVPAELGQKFIDEPAIQDSLQTYRSGDILAALEQFPESRIETGQASAEERLWLAALELSAGLVESASEKLDALEGESWDGAGEKIRIALLQLRDTVQGKLSSTQDPNKFITATEWMSQSYFHQAKFDISSAIDAAAQAVSLAPQSGFALARLAELEFASGKNHLAAEHLERSILISPLNAQALSLRGFLHAGANQLKEAESAFSDAIEIDPALSNAWLGRGLVRYKTGRTDLALEDLQVAVATDPTRAILRSYLAKIYRDQLNPEKALKELDIAKALDPNDPTPWMYSSLLRQQENQINQAVEDLEVSRELNDNRGVYRSRMLLDQDRAVRGANLALVYKDAGMFELSAREASRSVNTDYTSAASHLFLANSYDSLRDPRQINLRYESGWLGELLIANLLAPVGSGSLSQNVSLQEYSKLLEQDRPRLTSYTEYTSGGNWFERSSIYGSYRNMEYALDSNYRWDHGQRPNNDIEEMNWIGKFKYQVTPQDQIFLQVVTLDLDAGSGVQVYNNVTEGSRTLRIKDKSEPTLYAGWNHEWSPGSHLLGLFGRVDQSTQIQNSRFYPLLAVQNNGQITNLAINDVRTGSTPPVMHQNYVSDLELYSAELQQIWTTDFLTSIVGTRYQSGRIGVADNVQNFGSSFPPVYNNPVSDLNTKGNVERLTAYWYETWKIHPKLSLTGGVAFDYLEHPSNADSTPVSSQDTLRKQVSPKAGLIWSPTSSTFIRASYTHSLGGLFFDNGIRLEPTQVGGFLQSYRSLAPESFAGLLPGATFRIAGLGVDHRFKSKTYLGIETQWLRSGGDRVTGGYLWIRDLPGTRAAPIDFQESVDYEEMTLAANVYQLIGDSLTLGSRYRISQAEYHRQYTEFPTTFDETQEDMKGLLHQNTFYSYYYHPSGWFAQGEAVWSMQDPQSDLAGLDGDEFWQFHAFAGYRMWSRKMEARIGVLNIGDQAYQLHPINWYYELPRERTFFASLKLNF